MIEMTLHNAAKVLGCSAPSIDVTFKGVVIDSRKAEPGNLFAALSGQQSDGHEFLQQAGHSGAVAALVSRTVDSDLPQLRVKDVQAALGKLAASWRARHEVTVVGITGSNGKTTTRKMLSSIIGIRHGLLSTHGNYNNELGLPLTIFGLDQSHRFAVLEMGAAKAGDIAYLSSIARPQVAMVTNIGPAHLQGFGSVEGVARAKAEIYGGLPEDGVAVINADDPWKDVFFEASGSRKTVTFGKDRSCDVRLEQRGHANHVITPGGEFELNLALPGAHNIQNSLAAAAASLSLGIGIEDIQQGLAATRPAPGRLNLVKSEGGWTVIDDTYNANPASVYAALQVLVAHGGEPWLVLGDMKELGRKSRKLHAELGESARALGVKRLFAIGDATHATIDAFGPGGRYFDSIPALLETLCRDLHPGVTCLVKGSRSMGMERVVDAISGSGQWREAG